MPKSAAQKQAWRDWKKTPAGKIYVKRRNTRWRISPAGKANARKQRDRYRQRKKLIRLQTELSALPDAVGLMRESLLQEIEETMNKLNKQIIGEDK